MPGHSVRILPPPLTIGKKDLTVVVGASGRRRGRLTVSRGGIGWFSFRDKQERHFTWEQFDRLVKREFGER
jgi:hypothetical protein